MANKPLKPCASCKVKLVRDTYCDDCRKKQHKEYKDKRTDNKEQKFYNSKEWKIVRDVKRRKNPLCERCLKEGKIVPVDIVHHKVEVKDDWSKRLDLDNLESVCFMHHNEIHHGS